MQRNGEIALVSAGTVRDSSANEAALPDQFLTTTARHGRVGWCYIVGYGEGEPYKVGHSYNIDNRLNNLRSGNHRDLIVLIAFETRIPHCAEQQLQARFAPYHIRREWFDWNDDVADVIARMKRKNTKLLRKLYWTGHLRVGDDYDRCAKEIARLRGLA